MPSKHIGKKWHDRLFRHEFDHVAISTDQRPILILSFLVAHLKINDIKVATKSQLTKAFLGKIINARIDLIENEVESNYSRTMRIAKELFKNYEPENKNIKVLAGLIKGMTIK